MMANPPAETHEPERLTIAGIVSLVTHGWRVIVTLVCVFTVIAIFVSATATVQYRSYYIAMPAPTNGDSLRATASPMSLLGNAKSPDWEMYQAVLTSTTVTERLATDQKLMLQLFDRNWDAVNHRWKPLPNFWHMRLNSKINAIFGLHLERTPDKFALNDYLQHYLSVTPIPQTTMVTVSLDDPRPELAVRLLTELHETSNDIVRETRLSRAKGQRDHLLDELHRTTVADYTIILQQLLSRVESDIMTASIRGQYAGVLVDGPVSMPGPVFPRPMLFIQMAIVAGVVIGMILVVFTPLTDAHLLRCWEWIRVKLATLTRRRP